ncbi:hypothetical protein HMN09_00450900 [Mycena chlorophos]|uniref:Uncharacterized protein n=1 Tax=Mycena chlorophos TaxID=658473 RepID=A0A8H6WHM4_MYCCL|nr:hypothetical protein HMN09_00450900 [Mycena chlorophos]
MRFSQTLLAFASSVPLLARAVAIAVEQRTVSTEHGTISAPTAGASAASGASIPFAYIDNNWCHDGYSTITVWLTDAEPTANDVNSTSGELDDALYQFGTYLIPNFGLQNLPGSTPPPSTLTIPDLATSNIASGANLFLAVVETATACPPGINIPPQYGLTTVSLVAA